MQWLQAPHIIPAGFQARRELKVNWSRDERQHLSVQRIH